MNDTQIDQRVLEIYDRHRRAQTRYDAARLRVQSGDADARFDMIRADEELAKLAAEMHALREQGILR